ncbi:hypothetical protein [Arthrobacter castelli]|uniref:hypothetical protein n=1 Tax=Arthrobacter castelli TaxID=271431 RepID=UPI0004074F17|nr:hypothetical protein [Arthrobacter castelli]
MHDDQLRRATAGESLAAPLRSLVPVFARWPWYVQVGLVYAAARFVSWCIFVAVARHQGPGPWGDGEPGYLDFINIWDSEWYHRIYSEGYPGEIPRDDSGNALTNAWAFYPLFPLLVRVLTFITGLPWIVAAPLLATLAGLGAVLMIYKLFLLIDRRRLRGSASGTFDDAAMAGVRRSPHENALWGAALVSTFPVSAILQVPYAESLHLLLLAASLFALLRRDYLMAVPLVLLMCLARPTGVPFALLVLVHLLLRIWHRRSDPFPAGEAAKAGLLTMVSGAGALAWPAIAWWVTGDMRAYTETEAAWRSDGGIVPFLPWVQTGQRLFGDVLGWVAPLLLVAAVVVYLDSTAVRRLGTDLRLWCASYFLYLLVFLHPQTSTFRLLFPAFPLALAAVYVSKSRAYRASVIVLFTLLQIVWVAWLWLWDELPGGGDYPP